MCSYRAPYLCLHYWICASSIALWSWVLQAKSKFLVPNFYAEALLSTQMKLKLALNSSVKCMTWQMKQRRLGTRVWCTGVQLPKLWGCVRSCCLVFRERQEVSRSSLGSIVFHVRFRVLHYSTIPVIRVSICDFHRFCTREVLAFSYKNFPLKFSIVSYMVQKL